MAINTLITLKDALTAFAVGHGQLQGRIIFEADDHREPYITTESTFPLLFVAPIDVTVGRAMNVHTLRVYVYERINDDREDVLENANDTSLILRDIRVWWNDYGTDDILIVDDPIGTFACDRELDNLVGYFSDIRFEIPSHGRCSVPVNVTPNPTLSCEDATYEITDTDDNVLYSGSIVSGGNLDQVIQDSTVTNSDATYSASILAEGSLVLPDITVIDSDGSSSSFPSAKNVTCTPSPNTSLEVNGTPEGSVVAGSTVDIQLSDSGGTVTPTSVTQVGNDLQIVLPVAVVNSYSSLTNQTGQETIYEADDDGQSQYGKTVDFYTLSGIGSDWFFGHTRRFTGITGGYHDGTNYVDVNGNVTTKALAFPETIVLDWTQYDRLTGNVIGCQYNPTFSGNVTWLSAKASCFGFTTASFTTGWRWGNINEIEQFHNEGINPGFAYPPFEDITVGVSLWSSTTPLSDTTRARIIRNDTKVNNGLKSAASARAFPLRTFNISEL